MSIREIGCCGAYCRTCRALVPRGNCRGCKLGYEGGERDIDKSKCKIKVCCFSDRNLETCADCDKYLHCDVIRGFYEKKGYKYEKYRQAIEFIREKGYDAFMRMADNWKGPYGKID